MVLSITRGEPDILWTAVPPFLLLVSDDNGITGLVYSRSELVFRYVCSEMLPAPFPNLVYIWSVYDLI